MGSSIALDPKSPLLAEIQIHLHKPASGLNGGDEHGTICSFRRSSIEVADACPVGGHDPDFPHSRFVDSVQAEIEPAWLIFGSLWDVDKTAVAVVIVEVNLEHVGCYAGGEDDGEEGFGEHVGRVISGLLGKGLGGVSSGSSEVRCSGVW